MQRWEEVRKRVSAVALTDSVHTLSSTRASPEVRHWLAEVSQQNTEHKITSPR